MKLSRAFAPSIRFRCKPAWVTNSASTRIWHHTSFPVGRRAIFCVDGELVLTVTNGLWPYRTGARSMIEIERLQKKHKLSLLDEESNRPWKTCPPWDQGRVRSERYFWKIMKTASRISRYVFRSKLNIALAQNTAARNTKLMKNVALQSSSPTAFIQSQMAQETLERLWGDHFSFLFLYN